MKLTAGGGVVVVVAVDVVVAWASLFRRRRCCRHCRPCRRLVDVMLSSCCRFVVVAT